jgi:type VI secretion system protein ImpJ
MSWYSKVVWSEGLFLRQHHLQQHDRYVEHLVDMRVRSVSPYPWGFSAIEIDRDLAQQNKCLTPRRCPIQSMCRKAPSGALFI